MKIKLSALISDARGKLNGSYISRDNSGHVLRNKMRPTGTASIAQVRNRIAFQYIARRWDAITEQCRNEWRAYALTQPYKNIFGDTRYLSGIAMFIKTNLNHYISERPLEDCPTIDVVIFPPLDWIVAPPTSDSLWLTLELPPTFQHVLLVYATPQMNVGIDSRKKEFALIVRLTAGDFHNNKVNLIDKYEAVFGKLENGRAISLMIRQASTSGKVSLPTYQSVTANTIAPFATDLKIEGINNDTNVRVRANIYNQQLINSGEWMIEAQAPSEHNFCPLTGGGGLFTQNQLDQLMLGNWVNLYNRYPHMECIAFEITFTRLSDMHQTLSDRVWYNINDLPFQ